VRLLTAVGSPNTSSQIATESMLAMWQNKILFKAQKTQNFLIENFFTFFCFKTFIRF